MREFLAAVLTVIAMGVLLIAYTLSGARAAAMPTGLVQYDSRMDGYPMARPVVVVLDDFQNAFAGQPAIARLRERADVRLYTDHADSLDELARRLEGAVAVIPMRERTAFDAAVFERAPSLRLIAQTGGGMAHIDRAAAEQRGVRVVGTGGPSYPVPELTIGLIIGLLRRIPWADRAMRAGEWPTYVGEDCDGKTLGILGFGRIGSNVGRLGPTTIRQY